MPTPPHRKTIHHFNEAGHAHELTFSCYHRRPLLTDETYLPLLSESIRRATIAQRFQLIAFVYMPEHIHLLVYPTAPQATISALLYAIKRPFSFRIKTLLEQSNDRLLSTLTIQERPDKISFRFWQEGPGYDRNITSPTDLLTAINYLHNNPVRRNLCHTPADWKWSSWHAYNPTPYTNHPDLPPITPLTE
jgi:putative transposase